MALSLALMASVVAVPTLASDTAVDGIYYDFDESSLTASVTYRGAEDDWMYDATGSTLYVGDIVIPPTVVYGGRTYTVTAIGNDAFIGSRQMTGLALPHTVTSIGTGIFTACTSLRSITVDEANPVFLSSDRVLYRRSPLAFVFAPRAISGNVELPDAIGDLPASAFQNCTLLETIVVPDAVTHIGEAAFSGCTSLTDITIGSGVTSIGRSAFQGCTALGVVSVPSSVASIGHAAFYGCTGLTYLILNEGLRTIDSWAFYGCTQIAALMLPSTLTSVGDKAFYGCTSLKTILNRSSLDLTPGSESNGFLAYYATTVDNVDPTSVAHAAPPTPFAVRSLGSRAIAVSGLAGGRLQVFDIAGRRVHSSVPAAPTHTVVLPQAGVYIVVSGARRCRVAVGR